MVYVVMLVFVRSAGSGVCRNAYFVRSGGFGVCRYDYFERSGLWWLWCVSLCLFCNADLVRSWLW